MTSQIELFADIQELTGRVSSVKAKVGDRVQREQILATVDTDKVAVDVWAREPGTIVKVCINPKDNVQSDTVLFVLEVNESPEVARAVEAAQPEPRVAPPPAAADWPAIALTPVPRVAPAIIPAPPAQLAAAMDDRKGEPPHAGPAVRRTAREWGLDLSRVAGSGRKGRILEQDVKAYARSQFAAAPNPAGAASSLGFGPVTTEQAVARFGPIETRPLSRKRLLSAERLTHSAASIPHVTQFDSADITELEQFRTTLNAERGPDATKLTLLPFLFKACAAALLEFPDFNASLGEQQIFLKRYVHIGCAVETADGLVVPVVRDVERKTLLSIATALQELALKARSQRLSLEDVSGGSFTVSSLGGAGGRAFTPIINAPEVAILGVSKHALEPRWDGQAFRPRLMLPLSLSYDHRAIDGAAAARFLAHLCQLLSDLRRALL